MLRKGGIQFSKKKKREFKKSASSSSFHLDSGGKKKGYKNIGGGLMSLDDGDHLIKKLHNEALQM